MSKEYMHIHNAILILQEILPVFPIRSVNSASGTAIADAMAICLNTETRGDLKILASSYNARFQKAKSIWEAAPVPQPKVRIM